MYLKAVHGEKSFSFNQKMIYWIQAYTKLDIYKERNQQVKPSKLCLHQEFLFNPYLLKMFSMYLT